MLYYFDLIMRAASALPICSIWWSLRGAECLNFHHIQWELRALSISYIQLGTSRTKLLHCGETRQECVMYTVTYLVVLKRRASAWCNLYQLCVLASITTAVQLLLYGLHSIKNYVTVFLMCLDRTLCIHYCVNMSLAYKFV